MEWNKRSALKLVCALTLLLGALGVLIRLWFPPDPLAEFKTTVRVPLPDEARRTAETALAHIAANRMDELFGMMANQDSTVFEGRYVSGILAGNDFAPAKIGDEVRRLERSTVPHLIVRVHSVPRKRDYWLTLLNRDGKYLIGAISPVGKAL